MQLTDWISNIGVIVTLLVSASTLIYTIIISQKNRASNTALTKRAERVDSIKNSFSRIAALSHPLSVHNNKDMNLIVDIFEHYEIVKMTLQYNFLENLKIILSLKSLVFSAIEYLGLNNISPTQYKENYNKNMEELEPMLNKWLAIEWWRIQDIAITGKKRNNKHKEFEIEYDDYRKKHFDTLNITKL